MASRFRRRPAYHAAGGTGIPGDAGGISAEQETAADGYPHYQKAERRPDTEDNRTDIQKTQYH